MARRAALFVVLGLAGAASGAERVELRADCPPNADDTCFGDLHTLDHWLWQVRRPSAAAPVTVEVGAGEFRGRLTCRNQGHVTFRGQGASESRLVGSVDEFPFATVLADGCSALRFESLAVIAPRSHVHRGKAVRWRRGGESVWRDVTFEAEYIALYDSGCAPGNGLAPAGAHRFERVTVRAGALAYFSDCAHGIFTDSELTVRADETTNLPYLGRALAGVVAGLKVSHRGRAELRGCRVSVDARAVPRLAATIGLVAGAGGNEHPEGSGRIEMHGGALRVLGRGPSPVLAARADRAGASDAHAARIRLTGVTLEVSRDGAPVRDVFAGDGSFERTDGAR